MKNSISKQKTKRKKIMFKLNAVDAKEVHLVGEFNDWKSGAHPMKNDGNGLWIKRLFLSEGKFEYKFLVDNQWVEDPNNERVCYNCFGTRNSIVIVTA
jgi:1,4-alpha-glucan branching enzyme